MLRDGGGVGKVGVGGGRVWCMTLCQYRLRRECVRCVSLRSSAHIQVIFFSILLPCLSEFVIVMWPASRIS